MLLLSQSDSRGQLTAVFEEKNTEEDNQKDTAVFEERNIEEDNQVPSGAGARLTHPIKQMQVYASLFTDEDSLDIQRDASIVNESRMKLVSSRSR